MEDLQNVMPFLQSIGVSPEQLGPERLDMLKNLSKALSEDPSNIDENMISGIMKKLGMGITGAKPPDSSKKREKKIGRNEKCPCESGKKYKKCCGDITPIKTEQ